MAERKLAEIITDDSQSQDHLADTITSTSEQKVIPFPTHEVAGDVLPNVEGPDAEREKPEQSDNDSSKEKAKRPWKLLDLLHRVTENRRTESESKPKLEQAKVKSSALNQVAEVASTYFNYILHPTTTISSEKIRFLHYPQVLLSLPILGIVAGMPNVNVLTGFFAKDIAIALTAVYSVGLLYSILESKIAKKTAIVLDGSLEVITIKSPYEKEFNSGTTVSTEDTVGEFHWDPARRVRDHGKDERLLVMKTQLSFIQSFQDLVQRIESKDPELDKFKAYKITSELVDNTFNELGAEVAPLTDNFFFELLDHLTTRVNLLLNGRYKQALFKNVKTSNTAWFTPEAIVSEKTKGYLKTQSEKLQRLITIREKKIAENTN